MKDDLHHEVNRHLPQKLGEAHFKSRISPIRLTTLSTEWSHILQIAIDQVHETVLLEANDAIVL